MARLMERREMAARPHGFRSSLRDWIAETTNTPYEVAETTLGHTVGGKGNAHTGALTLLSSAAFCLETGQS